MDKHTAPPETNRTARPTIRRNNRIMRPKRWLAAAGAICAYLAAAVRRGIGDALPRVKRFFAIVRALGAYLASAAWRGIRRCFAAAGRAVQRAFPRVRRFFAVARALGAYLASAAWRGIRRLPAGAARCFAAAGAFFARLWAAARRALRVPRRVTEKIRALSRERHNNRFPESDLAAVQLLLLLWGCLPMLGGRMRERLLHRRKRSARGRGRWRSWAEELQLHPAIFLSGALVIAAVAVVLSLYTIGTSVSYDGTALGVVATAKTAERAVDAVESVTRTALSSQTYQIDRSLLAVQRQLVGRRTVEKQAALEQTLVETLDEVVYGYMLYVNGEPVAATTFPGALEELLEQMKIGYVTANTVECSFTEQVEVREEYVPRSELMNLGYIAEKINDTKVGEITYTVKDGDTYYGVAEQFDLTLEQLLGMNPGYDVDTLHAGDVLTVSRAVPYLTVVNVERQSYVRDVPFSVTYQDDDTMYQGEYQVLSAGVYGKADVTANVTYVNGAETGRQIVASVTLREPVAEVQIRGTKVRPSWFPTGTFRWPCYGSITSYFGYRSTGIAGATTYHEALDIANSTGTPIYASDGGTVVLAGWWSGTGYTVRIDHGNGFVTTYGHNSALLVNVGDHVYQGQLIARMGMTGVASGPHCHFGIQLNGTYVNPLNYLE